MTLVPPDAAISEPEVGSLTSLIAPEVRFSLATQETTTSYSTATIPGIGMVSGRAIKKLGERTIELAQNTRIRWRLIVIKNTIRRKPDAFWSQPNKEALDITEDLKEFINPEYPESIRRDAHLLARSLFIRQQLSDVGNTLRVTDEIRWDRPEQDSDTQIQHDVIQSDYILPDWELLPTKSSFISSPQAEPSFTKRQHALFKLLESERAYASDLALVRTIYIPLALGYPVPESLSASPSSSTSSLPISSASTLSPPMTTEDIKIIFNNIADLSMFSDYICDQLESAMGLSDEEDTVGSLFLQIIPHMQQPYKAYITRHRAADEHLRSLPKTPALEAYYAKIRSFATHVSHTWDLPSFLIKPVQRLLIYPLLLSAIIRETPDSHSDKENLRLAYSQIEAFTRKINEECKRAEVVKGVLSSKSEKKLRPPASLTLARTKFIKSPYRLPDMDEETALVTQLSTELDRIELFAHTFARDVLDWVKSTSVLTHALRTWTKSLGKVISVYEDHDSASLDFFLQTVEHILVCCGSLQTTVNKTLLRALANLLATMHEPRKLIVSMEDHETLHFQVVAMNARNRPPPQTLLEASSNYLALRAQLVNELPRYLGLVDRGISYLIIQLAKIQKSFYEEIRDYWKGFWDAVRVENEVLACTAAETISIWHERWQEVDFAISSLAITNTRNLPTPLLLIPDRSLNVSHPYPISAPKLKRGPEDRV